MWSKKISTPNRSFSCFEHPKMQFRASGVSVNAANATTGLPQQMSDDWIQNVADRIIDAANKTSDETLRQNKIAIADMLTLNRDKISKVVTVVNKDSKQINILKLGDY